MKVKTDTKERFHVITVLEPKLSASMTGEMEGSLVPYLQNDVKNLVVNFNEVQEMDSKAAQKLVEIQQLFYENQSSFVICQVQEAVEQFLEDEELLDLMNVTPTESEAYDIVQMEELERELLSDDDM